MRSVDMPEVSTIDDGPIGVLSTSEERELENLLQKIRDGYSTTIKDRQRLLELLKKRPIETDAKIVAKKLFGISLSGE